MSDQDVSRGFSTYDNVSHEVCSSGARIRLRLGPRYYPLPIGSRRCVWHHKKYDPARICWDDPLSPCELEAAGFWPRGIPSDITKGLGLPQPTLPDGRWIVMAPDVPTFSPHILPRLWKPLLARAKEIRPRILRHAYETTLERLQSWRGMGPQLLERLETQTQLIKENGHVPDGPDPLKDLAADWELFHWIGLWAPDLAEHPVRDFTPFERAYEILEKNTGYRRKTIESSLGAERRQAPGATVTPRRNGEKNSLTVELPRKIRAFDESLNSDPNRG